MRIVNINRASSSVTDIEQGLIDWRAGNLPITPIDALTHLLVDLGEVLEEHDLEEVSYLLEVNLPLIETALEEAPWTAKIIDRKVARARWLMDSRQPIVWAPGIILDVIKSVQCAAVSNTTAALLLRKALRVNPAIEPLGSKRDPRKQVIDALIEEKGFGQALHLVIKAQDFYPEDRGPGSPYYPEFEEAIVWAQLGSQAQAQLRGMQRSIQSLQLTGLDRFIGKSGDNDAEWSLLRMSKMVANRQKSEVQAAICRETGLEDIEEALPAFKGKMERLAEYRNRRCSLLQRALDLHFRLGNPSWWTEIHEPWWINKAPMGLIRRAHKSLFTHAVSEETVWELVAGERMFGRPVSSSKELNLVRAMPSYENLDQVPGLLEQGVEVEDCLRLPWALKPYFHRVLLAPDGARAAVLGEVALELAMMEGQLPAAKLGELLISRCANEHLPEEQDPHDAGAWLSALRRPAELANEEVEVALLASIASGQMELKKLPGWSKKARITRTNESITASSVRVIGVDGRPLADGQPLSLEAALEAASLQELDLVELKPADVPMCRIMRHVEQIPQATRRAMEMFTSPERAELYRQLLAGGAEIPGIIVHPPSTEDPGELLSRLQELATQRKAYADDALRWLQRHSSTPSHKLERAWPARSDAIASGVEDNVESILAWVKTSTLESACRQQGIDFDKLQRKEWADDLLRRYSPNVAVNFLWKVKPAGSSVLPPWKAEEGQLTFEVLPKEDPRGATLGYDTGCCMTLTGFSASCIYDGYARPEAGFIALYRAGRLVAQSFCFVEGDTLVLDNIEANAGRDFGGILDAYRKFLSAFAAEHPELGIQQVNLGTGFMAVPFRHLPITSIVMPSTWRLQYSDAKDDQRLLLDLREPQTPAWEEVPF